MTTRIIAQSTKEKIVETVVRTQAKVHGRVPLPTEIRRFCLIRSPHVDNDSREQLRDADSTAPIDIVGADIEGPSSRSSASTSPPASTSRSDPQV